MHCWPSASSSILNGGWLVPKCGKFGPIVSSLAVGAEPPLLSGAMSVVLRSHLLCEEEEEEVL